MYQFNYGAIPWLCARRQCLVEAFTAHASVLGQLCRAPCLCNIADCNEEHIRILVFKGCSEIFRYGLIVIEVFGSIKRSKFLLQSDELR